MTTDPQISEREREILRLVATGATNQQVAQQLNISINTVKVHLRNIFAKIGAASRTEATLYAVRTGLISIDQGAIPVEELQQIAPQNAVAVLEPPAAPVVQDVAYTPPITPIAPPAVPVVEQAPEPPIHQIVVVPQPTEIVPETAGIVAVPQQEATRKRFSPPLVVGVALGSLLLLAIMGIIATSWLRRTSTPLESQSTVVPAVNSWIEHQPMPEARTNSAAVAFGDTIYLVGGETTKGVSDSLLAYDPADERWTTLQAKPTAVSDIQARVIGGELFVPGGKTSNGASSAQLEVYNFASKNWRQARPLPAQRSGYGLATLDGRLYVFGGWDGQQFCKDVFVYDPASDSWENRTPMPTARRNVAAVASADSGKIYLLGGENESGKLPYNEEYTPSQEGSQPWQFSDPLPQPNSSFGAGIASNFIYVFGGTNATSARYDIRARSWQQLPPNVTPIGVGSAVTARDSSSLFIFGGTNDQPQATVTEYKALFNISIPITTN